VQQRGGIAALALGVVGGVSEEWGAEGKEVKSELVHPARLGDQLDERRCAPVLQDPIARRGRAARRMDGGPAGRRQRLDREHAAAREEMSRPRRAVGRHDGTLQEIRSRRAVFEQRSVHAPLGGIGDPSRDGEVGLHDVRRPGRVRGAERVRVPREEDDAGRLLVEPVNERELRAEALAERAEEAAMSVYRDSGLLVDGEIRVGPGRGREDRHAALRKRRAERMTARLPAMFAAMPITMGV
jgi:hypothetical protein